MTFIRLIWGAWLGVVMGVLIALAVYAVMLVALRAWLPEEERPVRRYNDDGWPVDSAAAGIVRL